MISLNFIFLLLTGMIISVIGNFLFHLPLLLPEFKWYRKWKGGNWYLIIEKKNKKRKVIWVSFWKTFLPADQYSNVLKVENHGGAKKQWVTY